ncbi:MAG TPA: HAMP domain-containing sensor histidine kinase [Oculatellaceae cyanobacterium]
MLRKTRLKLLVSNACVFLIVLSIFSAAVYFPVVRYLEKEQKRTLLTVTEAVIGSFETGEDVGPNDVVPELLEGDSKDLLPKTVAVQWFALNDHLLAKKGALTLTAPLIKSETEIQEQKTPHAIMVTRFISLSPRITGYLRVGLSCAEFDRYRGKLISSLVWGTIIALLAACIGALWLVRQSLLPVERTLKQLSQFTSDASHELRNPLMAIKTNADVALRFDGGIREGDREKFSKIMNATEQMIKTTVGLLQLARAEHSSDHLDLPPLDLSRAIEQIQQRFADTAAAKNVELIAQVEPNLVFPLAEEHLAVLLGNLLENAIQYTEPGGKVTIIGQKQGRKIKIEVSDTGIGIKKEELTRVFDRFWRSDKARTHHSGGSGLGLALVRSVAERYRGSVFVNSEFGVGTTVTVLFTCERGE